MSKKEVDLFKKSLKWLTREADAVFSRYVRQRDATSQGAVQCCTCGSWRDWKGLHCGHFLSRRYWATRFEEHNTGPQCAACNNWGQGEQVKFQRYLGQKYGPEALVRIFRKKNNIVHDRRLLCIAVIQEYREKLKELEKRKKKVDKQLPVF